MVMVMASRTCQGVFLALWGDCASLNECLKGLSVFTLENHLELFPAIAGEIFFLSFLNVFWYVMTDWLILPHFDLYRLFSFVMTHFGLKCLIFGVS